MIRFVNLRGQECISRFAFFDTVTDHFVKANGVQAWEDWEEFFGDCTDPKLITRCRSLCPPWVFEKETTLPEWITTPPTEPGWYWWRRLHDNPRNKWRIINIRTGSWPGLACCDPMNRDLTTPVAIGGEWWPVRIEEPPGGKQT